MSAAVISRLDEAIALTEEQLARSRAAREALQGVEEQCAAALAAARRALGETEAEGGSPPAAAAPHAPSRAGVLRLVVPPRRGEREPRLVPYYVSVTADAGVCFYASAEAAAACQAPLRRVPFYEVTTNSRGSRFKRAAVCLPLVGPDDGAGLAPDSPAVCFGLDFTDADGQARRVVLAAATDEERRAWVLFLSQYVELYLPPRAGSEEAHQRLVRGASAPRHRSHVIDGEAPGGTVP